MKSYRVIYLDAFTTTPFSGNPCAVLPDARGLTDAQMQDIARETNLPETAFVLPSDKADFAVRYFTPRYELPFAGHPTIATSFMMAQEGMIDLSGTLKTIQLEFKVGVLPVDIEIENGSPVKAIMTQKLPVFGKTCTIAEAAPCFGLVPSDFRDDCPIQVVSTGVQFIIVPVKNISVLEKVKMNRELLDELTKRVGVTAAFMYCLGGVAADADTHERLFDPNGTMEDPYTGSAAGCMGAHIIQYGLKSGPFIKAEQGHFVKRPGEGILEIQGKPNAITSVKLGGAAVKVLDGHVYIHD